MKTGTELMAERIANYEYDVVDYLGDFYVIEHASLEDNIVVLSGSGDSHEYDLMDVANCGSFYNHAE